MLKAYYQEKLIEAGVDEAGRGCLAGPVFAAAVILPPGFSHPLLNDSKQLTENNRNSLRNIIEKEAMGFAVARVDVEEIDRINILRATYKAMHLAIERLPCLPGFLLIDGNRFASYKNIPHRCIIKGDATYMSVAAASILAKTWRDEYMMKLHEEHPCYGWNRNKGYGTAMHRAAIEAYGRCPHHRKTFMVKNNPQTLFS